MSTIRANTVSDAAGTGPITLTGQVAPKVWVKYNQTADTILGSFNVSSVDDSGTGLFDVNFTNSFSAADDYVITGNGKEDSAGGTVTRFVQPRRTADAVDNSEFTSVNSSGTEADLAANHVTGVGDLA